MTDDRDPGLQALFDAAPRATANPTFVARVMTDIDGQRRKTIYGWIAAALLLTPVIWLISKPVVAAMSVATQLLPSSLIEIEPGLAAQMLAPINSVSGVVGLLFLGGWMFYRKIFR